MPRVAGRGGVLLGQDNHLHDQTDAEAEHHHIQAQAQMGGAHAKAGRRVRADGDHDDSRDGEDLVPAGRVINLPDPRRALRLSDC